MRKGDVVSYKSEGRWNMYASFEREDYYRLLSGTKSLVYLKSPKCVVAPRELFRNERIGT